jgi:hypothetical protein
VPIVQKQNLTATTSIQKHISLHADWLQPEMSTRPFFQDQDQDLVLQDQDQDFEKISRQDQDQDLTLQDQDQDQDQDLSSQDETKIKTFTADTLMLKSKQYATIQNLRKKYRPISSSH